MILSAIAEKLKRRSKDDFKGRHFEATLIVQAVSWYLRYPLSYRDIEELFLERGLAVDHATLNRWVLAYAPLIERRLRSFRKPHCGSIRIDETYIKIRGQWRYLCRLGRRGPAVNRHAPMTRRMSQTGAVRTFARSSRSAAARRSSIPSFRPNRMASSRMRAAIFQIFRSAPGPNLFRKERAAA